MSLILDALNRADQERAEENHTPNLHASHGPAPETSSPLRRWIIEGVIIVLALAAFGYSQWTDETVTPVTPVVEAEPAQAITVEKPVPAPPAPAPVAAAPKPKPVVETTVAKKPVEKPASNTSIASLYQQPAATTPMVKEPVVTAAPVVEPVMEAPVDNTQFILKQIPLITERSSRFQRGVPTLNYEVHVHSADDGAGFVKLNGRIARVGAQVAPGLRLIAILDDSIVLDLNGTQFRLPALNSWVNYK
ncbi:general secretion pathway protein GspB [Oceanicoccus sagamiensis]|uniref:Type II secretion system protein GspB C-terminal domain-containing protein n=1 Tax=Oceanicoccus sagamiensis TaxID=716816 RepID=A0A1X9NDJ5_9GAMM|nr:general secretion pathway protein GspB [Oceanicoccus sagamiensis]ARN73965.1 hypothetical protein BST96_07445 [Oceanicoccus sagamiensis]